MENSIGVDKILHQIESLDYDSKLNILEKLVTLLKRNKNTIETKLTELNGLGSEIWKDVNVENYLKSEREWD